MKQLIITIAVLTFLPFYLNAQTKNENGELRVNGEIVRYMVDEYGDTLLIADLDELHVSTPRWFKNRDDYLRYRRYKRYAIKVYPLGVDAIRIFREVERATNEMKKRKRKKYIKELQKELEENFEKQLKKLTKTQGLILMKMIEKELDTPLYYLIKDLRGGITATYWSTMGRLYGHRLKDGYTPGKDPIIDAVLNDLDVSHNL
ncbi:MAG: DUF4294 domain-containing protein [Bacteroidetes bacterium]|nr:DUF4294 domain-containing protein [Bacteroidota bacterium]